MADLIWVKLALNIFDDEKIKYFYMFGNGDAIFCIWIKLIVQAGKCNMGGKICLSRDMPYTLPMLAVILDRNEEELQKALKIFLDLKMIKFDKKGIFQITNWEKHQNIEALARIRAQTRKRVQKHREKKKEIFLSE